MRAPIVTGLVLAFVASSAACATGASDTGVSDLDATGAPQGAGDDGSATDASATPAPEAASDDGGSDGGVLSDDATDDAIDATDATDAGPTCVDTDAGCTTANPGACAPGTLQCDGGAAVCVPIASTQGCYSGPPSTRNQGVCKDGTQPCIGALGACTGDVLPAPHENCFNTLDDDCDGVLNNGCPVSLALGADRGLAGAGGGGGGAVSVHCPTGAFVTRVDSWFDDSDKHASGVSIYCATPSLVQGASAYSITLTPNAPAPYATAHGGNSPTNERADDCGITGLTAITYTVGAADNYVEGLGAHCGTSAVTLAADDTITFAFTTNGDTSYNAYAGGGGTFFDQACNANEVVVGYTLHTGSWMDNLQPLCAALLVNYK